MAAGGSFPGGVGGVLALVAVACLVGATFAALSNALALVAKQRETLIGAVTLDDVKRVAKRVLDPAKLSFLVVGNPEDLKPDQVVPAE